jgi:hypothetical protein
MITRFPLRPFLPLCIAALLILLEAGTALWFQAPVSSHCAWSLNFPANDHSFHSRNVADPIKKSFGADQLQDVTWAGQNGTRWQAYYFTWSSTSKTAQFARMHSPEICLTAAGKARQGRPEAREFKAGTFTLSFVRYQFSDRGERLYVYQGFWGRDGRPILSGPSDLKAQACSRLDAIREHRRLLVEKMIEIAVWGPSTPEAADAGLVKQLQAYLDLGHPPAARSEETQTSSFSSGSIAQ